MEYVSVELMSAIKALMEQRRAALERQHSEPTLTGKIAAKQDFNRLSSALQTLMGE